MATCFLSFLHVKELRKVFACFFFHVACVTQVFDCPFFDYRFVALCNVVGEEKSYNCSRCDDFAQQRPCNRLRLKFTGTTDLGDPVYHVWYIEYDKLALGCTDIQTYSCTSYSHLKAICDDLEVRKVGSMYKCRGNASKAKEGQGATVFHSFHPTLLNDHYHDTSRYCAPFSYFNVRKPPIETCQKIMEKLDYAEECSLSMLAKVVFVFSKESEDIFQYSRH